MKILTILARNTCSPCLDTALKSALVHIDISVSSASIHDDDDDDDDDDDEEEEEDKVEEDDDAVGGYGSPAH